MKTTKKQNQVAAWLAIFVFSLAALVVFSGCANKPIQDNGSGQSPAKPLAQNQKRPADENAGQTLPLPNQLPATQPPATSQSQNLDVQTETSQLLVKVVAADTGQPISQALVYLGADGASGYCRTNSQGQCEIKDFAWGDYSLGAFKKGYQRAQTRRHFKKGQNQLTLKLEKQAQPPKEITLAGTIVKKTTQAGSRSENNYYQIKTEAGTEYYLFNEFGLNTGFAQWVGQKVKINGFFGSGFIGWQRTKVEGIYVEEIHNHNFNNS